jgi:putative serine protease PepD
MSDYNRQFLFSESNVSVVKPKRSMRQRLAAKTTFLTGTAAVVLGALVGAGVGAGVGVVVYNSWT